MMRAYPGVGDGVLVGGGRVKMASSSPAATRPRRHRRRARQTGRRFGASSRSALRRKRPGVLTTEPAAPKAAREPDPLMRTARKRSAAHCELGFAVNVPAGPAQPSFSSSAAARGCRRMCTDAPVAAISPAAWPRRAQRFGRGARTRAQEIAQRRVLGLQVSLVEVPARDVRDHEAHARRRSSSVATSSTAPDLDACSSAWLR